MTQALRRSSGVSVVMTAYNRAPFIAEAIESVQRQTYTNWELIIVDDCSTDETLSIAQRYAAVDKRIRVILNDRNLGDYPNRNHGASFARREFLKYHDSDDVLYAHCLSTMVEMLVVAPTASFALTTGRYWPGGACPMITSPTNAYRREFLGTGMFSGGPACGLFRTDAFLASGGFTNYGAASDNIFWMELCSRETAVLVPGDLFWYRVHPGQELHSDRAAAAYAAADRRIWSLLNANSCPLTGAELECAKRNLAWRIFKEAVQELRRGKSSLARMRMEALSLGEWVTYLRRPRRSVFAGTPISRQTTVAVP